jgi:hypothetical protein
MGFVVKLLIFIVGITLGVVFVKYNFQLTQLFGHNYYAERYLGDGGTYTMWKLFGAFLMIGVIIYLFR